MLTGISYDNESRVLEIAVPIVSSISLVIQIHGDRSMVYEITGGVTWTSTRKNATIHMRTCVVYVI